MFPYTAPVPTGVTSQAAQQFYQYLWAYYLASIPAPRTNILWSGPIYIAVFIIILTVFFLLYVHFLHEHRRKGEMYGVMSFAGAILERIGPVSLFDIYVWVLLTALSIFYIVTEIIGGYVYVPPVH